MARPTISSLGQTRHGLIILLRFLVCSCQNNLEGVPIFWDRRGMAANREAGLDWIIFIYWIVSRREREREEREHLRNLEYMN